MIGTILARLRKKPPVVRQQIAFGAAGSITAVLLLVWITGARTGLNQMSPASDTNESPAFSTLINQVRDQAANISGAVSEATTQIRSIDTDELLSTSATTTSSTSTNTVSPETIATSSREVRIVTSTSSATTSTGTNQ